MKRESEHDNIHSKHHIGWNLDNSYAALPPKLYVFQKATRHASPSLVIFNRELAQRLGLDPDALEQGEGVDVFSGNTTPEGAMPLAQAYAGHQFGSFTMLGDGRALLLGEQIAPDGMRFDIQLKGSGVTPFSRRGDGKAALGPMLREYIISEAMHALDIPTTRSLAVIKTGEPVYRETVLPGAVLTRVAASHIRVGTFEYAYGIDEPSTLKALADYTIRRHFPELAEVDNPFLELLSAVTERQARLIAQWMLVGFIHGVMNTDNMAISGETIDYGPCAFMDAYKLDTVFSSIDAHGRYAYGNQPVIAQWNLARFAETLLPLIASDQDTAVQLAEEVIRKFSNIYETNRLDGMRRKLGLLDAQPDDKSLADDLLTMMQNYELDFTNTFRSLTDRQTIQLEASDLQSWIQRWLTRRDSQLTSKEHIIGTMLKANPVVIPRNHQVEAALEAAVKNDDYMPFHRLLSVLQRPFDITPENVAFREPPPPTQQKYRTFCGT
ncbi:MAG: YdiU family protein [Tannerella sp.]|jgi:uncharacterized protein YdiU (UPF0061 family)|nr:YdiU family protein [Tannerella sp.]